MDDVVHADAYADSCYRNAHDIKRDTHHAHDAKYRTKRDQIWRDGDGGELNAFKNNAKNDKKRQDHEAKRIYLWGDEALKEIVIKHHCAANLHASVVVCDQICDIGSKLVQKLVPA